MLFQTDRLVWLKISKIIRKDLSDYLETVRYPQADGIGFDIAVFVPGRLRSWPTDAGTTSGRNSKAHFNDCDDSLWKMGALLPFCVLNKQKFFNLEIFHM